MRKITPFTLRNKLLLFFLFFASAPILAFSYWTLAVLNEHSEETVLENLQGLARTKAQAIETFSQNRLRNIDKLSALSDIVSNVKIIVSGASKNMQSHPPGELQALEQEGGKLPISVEEKRTEEKDPNKTGRQVATAPAESPLAKLTNEQKDALAGLKKTLNVILSDQKEYEEILIINPSGVVIASTFGGHEGKTAKGIDYFQHGLKTTYFQHVFVSSITEKLTMVISTPIKDEMGNVLGVFAARLNLDLFFALVEDLSGLRRTGETIVAKEIDGKVTFMAPTRHDYRAALARTIEAGTTEQKPLQEAARGGRGTGRFFDYRNELCLAAWEYIPSLNWGLMVKIDRDEALQPYMDAQYRTILLTLVILFIGVLASLYVASALVKPIKMLQETADRISKGDMDVRISIFSHDEIGDLANSFGRMIASIKFLMEEKDRSQES